MPYIHHVRVRNGEIVAFRDFMSFQLAPSEDADEVLKTLQTTSE